MKTHSTMRQTAAIVSLGVLLGTGGQAVAGGHHGGHHGSGWATAGKILTGFVVADLLFNHAPACERTVVYNYGPPPRPCAPAVVYEQRVVYQAPPPPPRERVWVDSHYEYVPKKVWVDTSYEVQEWVPGHREPDGVWVDGHNIRRTVPAGRYETREEKVWVEGRWEYR